jgi:hypothetical protein
MKLDKIADARIQCGDEIWLFDSRTCTLAHPPILNPAEPVEARDGTFTPDVLVIDVDTDAEAEQALKRIQLLRPSILGEGA